MYMLWLNEIYSFRLLKHWLRTSIFVKIESNQNCSLYLYKNPICELCKTKFTDYIRHDGKLYELLDFKNHFNNYMIVQSITMDKKQNKYLYIVNLDQPDNKISIGRGRNCHLLLKDISVSRWHCFVTIDKNAKKLYMHDNNSKFGTLILVQIRNIVMCPDLKLCIQIGRTYLELLLKESFSIFNCCGVGEKKNADFFFVQNKEEGFILNKLTIRSDYDIEYSKKFKNKIEKEKPKNINNLETKPNLLNGENEEIKLDYKLKEDKDKKEEDNIDDIEKLIYEDEQNNSNNNIKVENINEG